MISLLLPVLSLAASPLELSATKGQAPLTVHVQGPPELLARAHECVFGFAGVGFFVDWGDGSPVHLNRQHPDCAALLVHTYSVAGAFDVKSEIVHPGPTDSPVTDWAGTVHVEVAAGPARTTELKIMAKFPPLYFGTGFPPVAYRVVTSSKAKLKAELVLSDGTVLFTRAKDVEFTGSDEVNFPDYGNGPSAEYFKNGSLRARVRLTLTAGDQAPVVARGPLFTISERNTFRQFHVTPLAGKAPLRVEAATRIFHPDCFSYLIDWGDGSKPDRSEEFIASPHCSLASEERKFAHTYARPGTYLLRWYDNNVDPFKPAAVGPGYLEARVKVNR